MKFQSEAGNSTYIALIAVAILALGVPVGSYLIDYMQGVQESRIENRFKRFEEEIPEEGPPEDYKPGGFVVTIPL